MIALAKTGLRAIAPDHRGYGLSDPPPQPDKASFADILTDLLILLDALQIAKDFGVRPAYLFAVLHPERVLGVVTIGSPYIPKRSTFLKYLPEGVYISRWRKPGDLATYGALYEKSGFQTALQVPYRSLGEDFNTTDPIVKVPVLLIRGGRDYSCKFPGMEDYINSGMKEFIPDLEIEFLPEGTHFVQELILTFLAKNV